MGVSVDELRDVGRRARAEVDTVRAACGFVNERCLKPILEDEYGLAVTPVKGVVVDGDGNTSTHHFLHVAAEDVSGVTTGPVVVDAAFDQFCDRFYREYILVPVTFGERDELPDVVVSPPDSHRTNYRW